MARLALLLVTLSTIVSGVMAKGAPPARPIIKAAAIPFTDFDAGNHSYSISFIIDHDDNCRGCTHTPPTKLYDSIVARCGALDTITSPATRDTMQMLAATQWNNAGVDYIYTDTIDYNDAMQACIQNIEKPGMQRNFKDAAAARARNDPENSQILASYAEANKTTGGEKSGGNRMGVGYGYAGLVLAVGMGAVVGMF